MSKTHAQLQKNAIANILVSSGLTSTVSESRRKVKEGAVKLNGVLVESFDEPVAYRDVLKCGHITVRVTGAALRSAPAATPSLTPEETEAVERMRELRTSIGMAAHVRSDVPTLLAIIEQQAGEIERLRGTCAMHQREQETIKRVMREVYKSDEALCCIERIVYSGNTSPEELLDDHRPAAFLVAELKADIERLRGLFHEHAWHEKSCGIYADKGPGECTCGFEAAKASVK